MIKEKSGVAISPSINKEKSYTSISLSLSNECIDSIKNMSESYSEDAGFRLGYNRIVEIAVGRMKTQKLIEVLSDQIKDNERLNKKVK